VGAEPICLPGIVLSFPLGRYLVSVWEILIGSGSEVRRASCSCWLGIVVGITNEGERGAIVVPGDPRRYSCCGRRGQSRGAGRFSVAALVIAFRPSARSVKGLVGDEAVVSLFCGDFGCVAIVPAFS